jgi:hypothetical protein
LDGTCASAAGTPESRRERIRRFWGEDMEKPGIEVERQAADGIRPTQSVGGLGAWTGSGRAVSGG